MSEETKIAAFQPKKLEAGATTIQPFRPRAFNTEPVNAEAAKAFQATASANSKSGLSSSGVKNSRFDLHPAAKKLLGVADEESGKVEATINAEVEARLSQIRDQAYQAGFDQGMIDGKAQAEVEFLASVKPLYDQFETFCRGFETIKPELYAANEQFLVQLMFQFGKHVILKELSTDPEYVKRLSALMIEKIGAKDHVKLKVSKQDYQNLEQIRDYLKAQFPDLKNIQIDVSEDLALGGCKVETDLARINASVETQLKSIEQSLGEA